MITTRTILLCSISTGINFHSKVDGKKCSKFSVDFPRSAALSFNPEQSSPMTRIYKPQIGSETISPIGIQCLIIVINLTPSLSSSFLDYLTTPIVLVFVQWIDLLQLQLCTIWSLSSIGIKHDWQQNIQSHVFAPNMPVMACWEHC
jgi:hypothetical protein